MPMQEHIESLRSKHARLEELIERIRGAQTRSDPLATH